ncbi:transcriptional regulator [Halovivax ruber XH-70]|uniref:Transcriptional regulator n=1 Tax=Halovivax ruber (strain DSM 18193 / JCM 13892 / XH-70) TaxID=797302 RepID=L0IFD8_HALRX|nr:helix-turn-helix domain-containing protein [Halovivax ruber]AGB17474.1 transcriptional regulator [Halovivax ruber XH-70]
MSQSMQAPTQTPKTPYSTTTPDYDVAAVVSAFDDPACRQILEATSDEARSAKEIAETTDLALSTTYRKLDELEETGLLEDGLRLRRSGNHTAEYTACLDEFVLSVSPEDGVQLRIAEGESVDGVGAI